MADCIYETTFYKTTKNSTLGMNNIVMFVCWWFFNKLHRWLHIAINKVDDDKRQTDDDGDDDKGCHTATSWSRSNK